VHVEQNIQETPTGVPVPDHFIGVEIGPAIIRAGVFSKSLRLVGKTKFSTKVERGPEAVMERVAKCVRYAADECDLPMQRVRAVGVGVPGRVSGETGMVELAPELGWKNVPLGLGMERQLALPAHAANLHNLGALGIYTQEAKAAPRRFAALFLGPQIGGGLILDGEIQDLAELPARPPFIESPPLNVFHALPGEAFRNYRSRDFRKALRKGNQAAAQFIGEIAERAGQIAAGLIRQFDLEVIAIGGGVLDEMREEILRRVDTAARRELEAVNPLETKIMASTLGDLAGITGAAVWASERGARPAALAAD
jgi:glucokinase